MREIEKSQVKSAERGIKYTATITCIALASYCLGEPPIDLTSTKLDLPIQRVDKLNC
jgi:hypothetical protein